MADDAALIRQTYQLAEEAADRDDFPFGALLAIDDEVVETATNRVESDEDITAHPELILARWASRELSHMERRNATLYASTEPCPMCAGAIYWAGIGRVVFGVRATRAGASDAIPSISCATIFESGTGDIEVVGPINEEEGVTVQQSFWERDPPLPFSEHVFGH